MPLCHKHVFYVLYAIDNGAHESCVNCDVYVINYSCPSGLMLEIIVCKCALSQPMQTCYNATNSYSHILPTLPIHANDNHSYRFIKCKT